jgi:diguanylate cyclase (GGDEF)-like protein
MDDRDDHSDVAGRYPLTDAADNARRLQFRWLAVIALADLLVIAIDRQQLGDNLSIAVNLRLFVVTPLVLLALAINRWFENRPLQIAASACATISLVVVTAIVGQLAPEPFASRYMMVAQFAIFAAAIFAGLPWRTTQIMAVVSTLAYALVVSGIVQAPHMAANLDLIGFSVLMTSIAMFIRRQNDLRLNAILVMRRIDAARAAELRKANARLAQLSSTDALTGVFNRRYLDIFAERVSTSIAPSVGSGVLMIDVDHFKLFNDHGGHTQGDRCLQQVAAAIQRALRSPDDIVVRYGGEEFVVILPTADRAETLAVAARLHRVVSDLRITHPGLEPGAIVTVSIGAYVAAPAEDLIEAIGRADELLYAAKKNGRDRVAA